MVRALALAREIVERPVVGGIVDAVVVEEVLVVKAGDGAAFDRNAVEHVVVGVRLQTHRIVIASVELVASHQVVERQELPGASDLGHLSPVQYADVGGVPGVHARQQLLHDAATGHYL